MSSSLSWSSPLFERSASVRTWRLVLAAFALMGGYYFLKVAREPLILQRGAELKSYAAAWQALLLLVLSLGYRALATRLPRAQLTALLYGGFALCIAAFAALAQLRWPIGVPFYLFVGVFNLAILSHFWSIANDSFGEEQGRRVFAWIGFGASAGAICGSFFAGWLLKSAGLVSVLFACIGCLLLSLWLVRKNQQNEAVSLRECARILHAETEEPKKRAKTDAVSKGEPSAEGDGKSVSSRRYLYWLAALIVLLNAFNALGEYVLDRVLLSELTARYGDHRSAPALSAIAAFKSSYFTYFNLLTLLLQACLSPWLLRKHGGHVALYVLPVISLCCWGTTAVMPLLTVVLWVKIIENSLDYSVQSTAWHSMFLVGSRSEKYNDKKLLDTAMVRFGDVLAALLIFALTQAALSVTGFVVLQLLLCGIWLYVVRRIHKEYSRRAAAAAQSAENVECVSRRSGKELRARSAEITAAAIAREAV